MVPKETSSNYTVQHSMNILDESAMTVGIVDCQADISGCLNGKFYLDGYGFIEGPFSVIAMPDNSILLKNEKNNEIHLPQEVKLKAEKDSTFTLFQVTIGKQFHWERKESQTFQGSLIFKCRKDGTMAIINEIHIEDYLKSVISSEMNSNAPVEFLKAHSIISRSWLIAALYRKRKGRNKFVKEKEKINTSSCASVKGPQEISPDDAKGVVNSHTSEIPEIIRWYEQEDHDLYDVCADDHCQRYQGITKIFSDNVEKSVLETRGKVITYKGEVCDARYSKACGGITESFETAWSDTPIAYLSSISDGEVFFVPVMTEEDAEKWILSEPPAYCNTEDPENLAKILPDFDRETKAFYRWKVKYKREELEEILLEKSGIDFGVLKNIQPLSRGSSGRIFRLKITGSKISFVVGKELEIRRWLSRTHLYSSAFIVVEERSPISSEVENFVFYGAGWGHGVGLCQIGAAVMATKGFKAEKILMHYFPGVEIKRLY